MAWGGSKGTRRPAPCNVRNSAFGHEHAGDGMNEEMGRDETSLPGDPGPGAVTFETARDTVFSHLPPPREETVDLLDALGRVLASDVVADQDDPGEDRSLRDGYALISRASNTARPAEPAAFSIRHSVSAGDVPDFTLDEMECVSIATGAPLPEGTDTVVPLEEARIEGDRLLLSAPVGGGTHVRRRGEHFRRGDVLAPAGRVVRPEEIQALASSGLSRVKTVAFPSVAVISTGSELVDAGESVGAGQVRASNLYFIASYVRLASGRSPEMNIVPDQPAAIENALRETESDIVVTTGGTSKGRKDFMREVLASLGAKIHFDSVTMLPGRSFFFATLDGRAVFCFPGSPGASRTLAWLFLCPAIHLASGRRSVETRDLAAVLTDDITTGRGFTRFLPARVTQHAEGYRVRPATGNLRELYFPSPEVNGLLYIPPDVDFLTAGYEVRVILLEEIDRETEGF